MDSLLQVNIGCTCIVCGEDYETPNLCAACKVWAHEECTPKEGDAYLCDVRGANKN